MIHVQYFIAVIGNRVVSFAAFLLLAYMITPHEFGLYTLAFTNSTLVYALASTWITMGGGRLVSLAHETDRAVEHTVVASLLGTLAVIALGVLAYLIQPFRPVPPILAVLVGCWSAALIIYDVTGMLQTSRQQVAAYARFALTRNVAGSAFALAGAWLGNAEGAIAGQIIGALGATIALSSARSVWFGLSPRLGQWSHVRTMLHFGGIATCVTSLYTLTNFAIRNPVVATLGEAATGRFALATDLLFVPIALVINAFGATVGVAASRHSMDEDPKRRSEALAGYVDQMLLVIIPYGVGGVLLASSLVDFLLPGRLGSQLAGIATPAAAFAAALALAYSLAGLLLTFKLYRPLLVITIMMTLAMFAASLHFAPRGLAPLFWAVAVVAAAAAAAVYIVLGTAGRAGLMNRERAGIALATLAMAGVVIVYRSINQVEPVTAVLLGVVVYFVILDRAKVMKWTDLLARRLPEAPAVSPQINTDVG